MKGIIFGVGDYGKRAYKGLKEFYNIDIVAFADNDSSKWGSEVYGVKVIDPKSILNLDYDKVFVSTVSTTAIIEICHQLSCIGIEKSKIEVLEQTKDFRNVYTDTRRNWIRQYGSYVDSINLRGNVAECGVHRGETAMFINEGFPKKKLYLFDTFAGFDKRDTDYENKYKEYRESEFNFDLHPFIGEPIEAVVDKIKNRMPYPENICFRIGYFPETAEGIDDIFCFVNLDMDLYKPMYAGLEFFWNKMVKGGCILLHDYFHPDLPGVKDAVHDFESKLGRIIPKITIGDGCSIALIKD